MAIQYERIKKTIAALAAYGTLPQGGTTRLSYTAEYLAAQAFLQREMLESGMLAEVDPIGNLIGTYVGREPELTAVMSGSHLDTVPAGGNFDGALGIVAALECVRSWQEEGYRPKRTVRVIATIEEECTAFGMACFGVRVRGGEFKKQQPESIVHLTGGSLAECLQEAGLPHSALQDAAVGFQDLAAFVELHIEQGCVLESNGQSIGVVNAIVGQRRYTVTLNGESNHAGTTPMGYRRDTVYAFSRICHQSVEKAKKMGDPLVLTFGKVEPRPNTVNVVPGKTTFTIDCRHTDATVLRDFTQQLENDMRAICDEMDIGIDIDLWMDEEPVPMNKELVATLTELCESEKLNYRVMHSGAGHDAQIFAPRVPTCMIFIPSINGISHNPAERTNITDLAEGVKTLALMLYQLAWQK